MISGNLSIKNDSWITSQCTGPRFDYYFKEQLVHKGMPLQEIRLPDVVQKLAKLKLGQAYLDEDGYTRLVKVSDGDMIVPFVEGSVNRIERGGTGGPWVKAPSHGLSSYGYDIRLGRNFKVMTAYRSAAHHVIDPTEPENMEGFFKDVNDVWALEMAPHSFALGVAMELINMPPNVTGICMPKSSLARCGLVAAITPIEAGWSGYLTLELKNETDHPLRIHAGMGIMQLIFLEGEPCDVTYAARKGKYQNQHAFPVVAR